MKRLKTKLLSVVMSVTMLLTMMPNNVFAQGETFVPSEEVQNSENLDFVETKTPASIGLRSTVNNRTFDIQGVDYRRSSMNPGARYESKWEGVAPYAPLFGHMVNNGKYTRPLGKENGDLGRGWGSSDYMTGYLLVDIEKFGEKGTENLPKDEYGLANIGIVRVDNKYSRNDDFESWKESIEEAFKEYNGNEGFTKKGYAGGSAYQETKLVIWDGYKRLRGIDRKTEKEYITEVEDIDAINTSKRQELANYIKKHLENGAKLQGYITTDYGLKDVYEPSETLYRTYEKQIRYLPHIKITGVTYDVELEYENAPSEVELPKIVSVNAGHKLVLPEIDGYDIVILDGFGKEITDEIFVEKNMKVKVKLAQIDYEQDKDGDGLFDIFEKMIGTDPDNMDTDGDGLTDGFEYNYLTTDPLLKDTNGNKVSDADEDFDNDGLSNIEEQRLNTDPSSSDTDGDALKDADEVNVYKTNPLLRDTDNDGIDDADEIKLGLDPTNPSSDGVTLDSERKFEQVADDSIKDDSLLNSNNFLIPTVSGNVPGNISKNVKIEKSYSSTFNENRSVLSDIIHLEKTYKEQLTLSFQFKEKYVGDIKNISIVSYSKTGLKLVDTKIDENNLKIYGEISENADYFVIDVDEFLKGLGIDVFANVIEEVEFVEAKMYSDNNAFVSYDKFENKNYSDDYSKNDYDFLYDNYGNVIDKKEKVSLNEILKTTTPAYLYTNLLGVSTSTSNSITFKSIDKASGATGKADIVFVVDTTGSMGGAISNTKNNINDFSKRLVDEYNIDANFSLIEFKDITYDGDKSTKQHKNNTSNWFTNINYFKNKVNALYPSGGGDTPETVIDALAMAYGLNYRNDATKFVILVTDAPYKTDNSYGIKDMQEMSELFSKNNIIVSAISYDENWYKQIIDQTAGLFGYIYGDFSEILLKLANRIGKLTNDGEWVFLDDYSAVKLSDTIDKIGINDTDNDGLSDAEELGTSIEKSMMSFIELLLNRNNIPKENYIGKKTINVWEYISNPTLIDTDYDGIPDGEKDYDEISTVSMFNSGGYRSIKTRLDEEPRSGEFEATAYWNEGDKNFSTKNPIQFTVDYRMFFENNKNYKSDIARLAWLYAFDIYSYNPEKETEDKVFIKTTKVPNINTKNDNTKLQKTFGMKDVENIVINKDNYSEDKDDITEIVIGHRKVEYNGKEKEIVLLVVRGTNGTHSEWSSNFDVGADTKQYYDATGEKHPHWKNKYNHKGFDVTANRVIEKVNGYLSRHSLNSGSILITGHSRGAAVANLLGKYFVDSKKFDVYTYAFATPNNTTTKNIGNYNEIFNIVNDDDLIPYMPLTKWGFNKYGQIKRISVKDNYEDSSVFGDKKYTFEWLTGEDYNPDGGTKRTIDAFGKLANNREELYVMDSSNDGKAIENEYRSTNYNEATARIKKCKEDLETEKLLRFSKVEIEKDSGTLVSFYRAKVNYCPAYVMQTLANMASEVGPRTGRNLSGKYNSAKWSFIASSGEIKIKEKAIIGGKAIISEKAIVGGMTHPHMPITYYLIVNNDFKNI